MLKCRRRQMASTSIRNLLAHIAVVSFVHFILSTFKWPHLRNLSDGAKQFILILERTFAAPFKPRPPHHIFNTDTTSQYYYTGVKKIENKKLFTRVNKNALENKSSHSLWKDSDN